MALSLTNEYQFLGKSNGISPQGDDQYYYYYILLYGKQTDQKISIKAIMACDGDATFYGATGTSGRLYIDNQEKLQCVPCPEIDWSESDSLSADGEDFARHTTIMEYEYENTDPEKKELIIKVIWSSTGESEEGYIPGADDYSVQVTVNISSGQPDVPVVPDEPDKPAARLTGLIPRFLIMGWDFGRHLQLNALYNM